MASIAPALGPSCDLTDSAQPGRTRVWSTKLQRAWQHMQLSYYGGAYSIHRALAFDEYTRNTSSARVVLVCLATPLPMVGLVYGQELIPLQELKEGWSANYGMWIRAAVLVGIVTHALLIQATYLIDDFSVSLYQMIQLYIIMPAIVVAFSLVVSASFVFPIPFYVMFVTPPFYLLLIIMLRLVVGAHAFRQMLRNQVQVIRCVRFVCAQTSTVFIFPVYEMLFSAAEGTRYQLPIILLLPLIKVALKNLVLHFAKVLEDMAPVEVIFTADFFNAIYVATCMQSSTSIVSISAITITDLSQTIIMLYGLHRRTATIRLRLLEAIENTSDRANILSIVCLMCHKHESLSNHSHPRIRRRSCLPLQVSNVNKLLLDSLEPTFSEAASETGIRRGTPTGTASPNISQDASSTFRQSSCTQKHPNVIHPIIPGKEKLARRMTQDKSLASKKVASIQDALSNHPTILLESLQAFFTMECLVTTTYLEAFMPIFYSSYMILMVHLPNVQYHMEMTSVTRENVGSSVFPLIVFGVLQITSFLLLSFVIKRNCGMKALYHLSFVLETQRSLVQCKMMLWMVITLCFRVTHFGVDFKFEFIRLGFPKYWVPQG